MNYPLPHLICFLYMYCNVHTSTSTSSYIFGEKDLIDNSREKMFYVG